MAVSKPTYLESDIWANGAPSSEIQKPTSGKISEGWQYGEKPPHEYFNWRWQTHDQFLVHIMQNGIPQWDADTVYNKGAVTLYNETLYHATAQNQGEQPDTSSNWALGPGSSAVAFTDLTDVDLTSPTDKQIVYYNGSTNQWENDDLATLTSGSLSINDLSDVNAPTPGDGEILVYDAAQGQFVSAPNSGGGGGSGLGELYKYQFIATDGQTDFSCTYNPNWVYVSVDGIDLQDEEFTAVDGSTITLTNPANEGAIVRVFSATKGGAKFEEYNFDASAGQTDFVVNNLVFTQARIFKDGIRVRNNEYTISDDGTDTTVSFNTAMNGGEWILIDVAI